MVPSVTVMLNCCIVAVKARSAGVLMNAAFAIKPGVADQDETTSDVTESAVPVHSITPARMFGTSVPSVRAQKEKVTVFPRSAIARSDSMICAGPN